MTYFSLSCQKTKQRNGRLCLFRYSIRMAELPKSTWDKYGTIDVRTSDPDSTVRGHSCDHLSKLQFQLLASAFLDAKSAALPEMVLEYLHGDMRATTIDHRISYLLLRRTSIV